MKTFILKMGKKRMRMTEQKIGLSSACDISASIKAHNIFQKEQINLR